jgi:BirA family biotin operon repressor/biotin-[acetyl-CoA-carboxylase] ligase
VGRVVFDRLDSTMAEAERRAGMLERPTWIMAAEQTAARGRRGRRWRGGRGNFAATLAMDGPPDPARAALYSFVAALALHDAFLDIGVEPGALALKWPNDVLLNDGKIAGILLERTGAAALLVGIGVNLADAPAPDEVEEGAVRPVALAPETGLDVSPARFLDALGPAFADWAARIEAEGFGPVREAWLARAARLGDPIRARVGAEEIAGTFQDVDGAGHLVIATDAGPRAVAAAEVYFPPE